MDNGRKQEHNARVARTRNKRLEERHEGESPKELLHLNSLQPLNTSPYGLADPDRQFAAFQPLVNKPQAHDELLLVQ